MKIITHIYGITSIFLCIVSLIVSLNKDTTWTSALLFSAGWIVAIVNTSILFKVLDRGWKDTLELGKLKEKLKKAKEENSHLLKISDFLASNQMGQQAISRKLK